MPIRVTHEVHDDLSKRGLVAEHTERRHILGREHSPREVHDRNLARGIEGPQILHHILDDPRRIERHEVEGALLVEPREPQERFDEGAHAFGFVLDAPHRLCDVFFVRHRPHAIQLAVAANRGERRAKFV